MDEARRVFQTAIDVCIATPARLAVWAVCMPTMAFALGVVRGLSDVSGYIRGEGGGLRLLAAAEEAERERANQAYRDLPRAPYGYDP